MEEDYETPVDTLQTARPGAIEVSRPGTYENIRREMRVETEEEDPKSRQRMKVFVLLGIGLLLLSLSIGLYFALRPENPEPGLGRFLPCPRYPTLNGPYVESDCQLQKNCIWVGSERSTPYRCLYDTRVTSWTLTEVDSNSFSKFYSLISESRNLKLKLFCRTMNEMRLQITELNRQRYEVPDEALPIPDSQVSCNTTGYYFTVSEKIFQLSRNGVTLLSIPFDGGFVFDDQFLQITLQLNSSTNYGFGEHNHRRLNLDMNYKTWAIYTRDLAPVDEWNLYGAQPYFMSVSSQHKFVLGTLLKNSNAMDVFLQPDPSPSVTYRIIGGVIDFHFFVDDNPGSVTQHYTSLIGRPLMPPYWSLGFQLSRWGYQNTSHLQEVVNRNQAAGIPLDVVYGDIDYMAHKFDFTYNTTTFAGLPQYVTKLRRNHTRYVIILDPGIGIESDKIQDLDGGVYKALKDGNTTYDIFIKDKDGKPVIGKVWPGLVYYPDFTHQNATAWWTDQISDFYNNSRRVSDSGIKFDGLWVDMNEPSNFREGAAAEEGCDMDNLLNSPPYIPENLFKNSLVDKTICMDSVQHWGSHYNVHSLYGHSMAMSTYRSLEKLFPTKRPFVLTRSTFTGTSQYAIHWLGDNQSQWRQIPWSIVSMLEYSMFGFSMTGSDICGFWFDTTESMCQRWMQLGAFYPFARNHNAGMDGARLHMDQDPANFGENMIRSSRDVLLTRYKLLPYLYTLMFNAHSTGTTVARPLFYEFMDDIVTHNISRQFLWGPALLISPCMEKDSVEVDAYIPEGTWYNYFSGIEVDNTKKWHTIHTPLDRINVHVRGGYIIPWQNITSRDVNTYLSRRKEFGLLVALNYTEKASGELYIDDGEGADSMKPGKHCLVKFSAAYGRLHITLAESGCIPASANARTTMVGNINMRLLTVEILGVSRRVSYVVVDNGKVNNYAYKHDVASKILTVDILDLTFTYLKNHTIEWAST